MKVLLINGEFFTDNDERTLLKVKIAPPCTLKNGFGNLVIQYDTPTGAVDTFFLNVETDLLYLVDTFNPYRQ